MGRVLVTNGWVARVGLTEKLAFKQRLEEKKKDPKMGNCLLCFRNIKAAGVAGVQRTRAKMVKDEVREVDRDRL